MENFRAESGQPGVAASAAIFSMGCAGIQRTICRRGERKIEKVMQNDAF